MARIKANIRYDEWNKISYFRWFDIVDDLPEHVEVITVSLDISQPNEEVGNYEYFECITEDEDGERVSEYYAISKYRDKDISIKTYQTNADVFVSEKNFITNEYETECFTIDFDGMEFEDDDEAEEYIIDKCINKINECFLLNDDDYRKIVDELKIFADKWIVEE